MSQKQRIIFLANNESLCQKTINSFMIAKIKLSTKALFSKSLIIS